MARSPEKCLAFLFRWRENKRKEAEHPLNQEDAETPASGTQADPTLEQEAVSGYAEIVILCHPRNVSDLVALFETQIKHAKKALSLLRPSPCGSRKKARRLVGANTARTACGRSLAGEWFAIMRRGEEKNRLLVSHAEEAQPIEASQRFSCHFREK